jgi:hypothetical protein
MKATQHTNTTMARTQLKPTTRKASKSFPTFGIKKVTKSKPLTKPRTPAQIDVLVTLLMCEDSDSDLSDDEPLLPSRPAPRPSRTIAAAPSPKDPRKNPKFQRLEVLHTRSRRVLVANFEHREGTEYLELPPLWRQAAYYDWVDYTYGLLEPIASVRGALR